MDHAVPRWMRWAVTLLALRTVVTAQSIAPADAFGNDSVGGELALSDTNTADATPRGVFILVGLTGNAVRWTRSQDIHGTLLEVEPSNSPSIKQTDIALISCDPEDYSSMLDTNYVVNLALDNNAVAVVLYSKTHASCNASGIADTALVYTMNSEEDTDLLLETVGNARYGTIAARGAFPQTNPDGNSDSQTTNSNNSNNNNPLGPAPSTAVAMIILYSITGVITALFLIIIVTGAIRAHRHPERYGPRNIIGRPRQSRARGLARAMLETIPIVKFGDRETEQKTKQTDVELAEGRHGPVEVLPDQITRSSSATSGPSADEVNRSTARTDNQQESGIAAAVNEERPKTPSGNQGCSICTEDFEVGQDQRVLPCDHRFHPECVDPWLLNVSGTCPLCRIDLRPQDTASPDEVDENGNPARRGSQNDLAPPLDNEANRRMGIRRSILAGLLGARPERMTREERVNALRQYREQEAAIQTSDGGAEDESRVRWRLRNAFRIRTRRTGANGEVSDVPDQ